MFTLLYLGDEAWVERESADLDRVLLLAKDMLQAGYRIKVVPMP